MTPTNEKVYNLIFELEKRFQNLRSVLRGRKLKDKYEGLKSGAWKHPELRIFINDSERNLAVADFKSILKEIERLKT